MQSRDFNNLFVRDVARKIRELNNLMFMLALRAEDIDKGFSFNESARQVLGWPAHITNMYEYRMMWDVDYNRLYQICIISHCSELEYFFKTLFDKYPHLPKKNNNFYQKFGLVIEELKKTGIDFTSIQQDIDLVSIAFQVRHIGIHNMSIVDEYFKKNTKGLGTLGQPFVVTQEFVTDTSTAIDKILKHLDDALPPVPA
ncbi:hypothetical protein [Pantoea eucalypti]|jgi:hypothetical protein|uniref:hypothetical protein n=1 Tax=Pantoea eucalypti TaxID=470933 RepID=UPI003FA4D472